MSPEDLANRFTYHPPRPDQAPKYPVIRDAAHDLAKIIDTLAPDGREKSLAITALEEAVMWANAGIARETPVETTPARIPDCSSTYNGEKCVRLKDHPEMHRNATGGWTWDDNHADDRGPCPDSECILLRHDGPHVLGRTNRG